jgi:uroporphyrinogen-III synthase
LATSDAKPLAGKRIVITRAREQAASLAEPLERLGAEVILLPSVTFAPANDTVALDHALAELERFDWLLLTSQNAVRYFCERCRVVGVELAKLRARVGVVGPATAEAARREGLEVSAVATRHSGESLAEELGPALSGKSVLLPRSDRAGNALPKALRAAGASVVDVVAYRTLSPPAAGDGGSLADTMASAHVVVFASPSAAHHFSEQAGPEIMEKLKASAVFAAIGPTTAATLREQGIEVGIEAKDSTASGLVAAIVEYFCRSSPVEVRNK